jgi:phosphoribosylanthranilate isomerase
LPGCPERPAPSIAATPEICHVFHCPRTRIKICGLTREQDVDAAVAAGADAVGFVLYAPSPRAVTLQRAAELARRLPPFVTPVLLFVNETATNVIAACDLIPNACVQFHGDESPRIARPPPGASSPGCAPRAYPLETMRRV